MKGDKDMIRIVSIAGALLAMFAIIGSDGLIMILPSEVADCRMRMFNADGSEGMMCGNGIRCVGKFAYDNGIVTKPEVDK